MTSPSESFKKKLMEPINALFKVALEGDGSPSVARGGRNWQLPGMGNFAGSSPNGGDKERPKPKLGTVDEAAFKEAMHAVNGLVGLRSAKRSIRGLADFGSSCPSPRSASTAFSRALRGQGRPPLLGCWEKSCTLSASWKRDTRLKSIRPDLWVSISARRQ